MLVWPLRPPRRRFGRRPQRPQEHRRGAAVAELRAAAHRRRPAPEQRSLGRVRARALHAGGRRTGGSTDAQADRRGDPVGARRRGRDVPAGLVPLIAILAGAAGLAFAWGLFEGVRRQPAGAPAMERLERLIRGGALTFLAREYSGLLPFLAVVGPLLAWAIGWRPALPYSGGAGCSVPAGPLGLDAATAPHRR